MTDFNEMSATFRLYGIPSFTDGMAMALDYARTMPEFNTDSSPAAADGKALVADWAAVDSDFANAMNLQTR
jgi:hypothetical protein